jgi:hypothetical protein
MSLFRDFLLKKTSTKKGCSMAKHFDGGSMIVIIVTFVLFILALFAKGFTQDLLLEAGVFLVSVKLILMAYHNSIYIKSIENELKEIKGLLKEKEDHLPISCSSLG